MTVSARLRVTALAALLLCNSSMAFAQATGNEPTQSVFTPNQRAEIIGIIRSALKSDPSILRDAVLALQQQQDDVGATSRVVSANRQELYAAGDQIAGNPNGNVALVEFFDVRCPYCRRMLPVIDQFLHDDGNVKLILKDLPILGPASVLGSKALLAARAQGAYLKMQSALMQDDVVVDEAGVQHAALAIGLDWPRLQRDMADPTIMARIDANLALAQKLAIQGTPALIAGDHVLDGAMTADDLKAAVAALRR